MTILAKSELASMSKQPTLFTVLIFSNGFGFNLIAFDLILRMCHPMFLVNKICLRLVEQTPKSI